jgi:pimeloyl-ACP methyl ester carboxylesterase
MEVNSVTAASGERMTIGTNLSVADRIAQVLDHLGIERAHFAASMLADVAGFAQAHPKRIASLTLICPPRVDPGPLRALGARLQIVTGDQGRPSAMVRDAVKSLPEATVVWLPGYFSPPWADVVADRTAEIESALVMFFRGDHRMKSSPATHRALSQAATY